MRINHSPFVLDGAAVRLFPGPQRSLAEGPGRISRGGIASIILWCAGRGIRDTDLFAFWDYDATRIDWLTGFLCDDETTVWFDKLANPPEEEEEPEELFGRGSMNTLGSDVVDDV